VRFFAQSFSLNHIVFLTLTKAFAGRQGHLCPANNLVCYLKFEQPLSGSDYFAISFIFNWVFFLREFDLLG